MDEFLLSPFTHAQIHSLSQGDLAAAICNALTTLPLGYEAAGRSLIHQIQVSLDMSYPCPRATEAITR